MQSQFSMDVLTSKSEPPGTGVFLWPFGISVWVFSQRLVSSVWLPSFFSISSLTPGEKTVVLILRVTLEVVPQDFGPKCLFCRRFRKFCVFFLPFLRLSCRILSHMLSSELFDTFFIVIHKKPLMFLHWYHHISVLLFTWHAYVNNSPTGAFFIAMNYGVHAMMYFYYFLMAVRMKPKWFNPIWITVAQISQMFVGVFLTILTTYILHVEEREDCLMRKDINQSALVMYGSYLFLFCKFFVERYYLRGKKSEKTAKKVD